MTLVKVEANLILFIELMVLLGTCDESNPYVFFVIFICFSLFAMPSSSSDLFRHHLSAYVEHFTKIPVPVRLV